MWLLDSSQKLSFIGQFGRVFSIRGEVPDNLVPVLRLKFDLLQHCPEADKLQELLFVIHELQSTHPSSSI
jgi:hypothetical protein